MRSCLSGPRPGSGPKEGLEQGVGALGGQRVDPELRVVGLAPPAVLVLRAVVHEEEEARRGQALQQGVEQGLGLGVDPVEVLEDQEQRLDLALPQEEALAGVQGPLAALGGIQGLPLSVLDGHIQEGQEGRQGGLEGPIQGEEFAGDLLADLPHIVAALDLAVGLEEVDHGQVGGGLAIGHRAALQDQPALGPM